ncbi:hypothetical protein JYU34_004331 [Plutella xylostella]|uniref:FLYWCH-type domain-containing protein n=1 Tax=Plutella xylostella TaxID=51655 RepID=A0ABQ7QXQ8_PLUXY|nr:hypothetical protein JYU34_004331 [Plutella xylostella]
MHEGHTFCKSGQRKYGLRYLCCKRLRKRCRAEVTVSFDGKHIILYKGAHNHDVPEFHINGDGTYRKMRESQFITLTNGKVLLMYAGHTFSKSGKLKHGFRYQCSKMRTKKCRAEITISFDCLEVVRVKGGHNHETTTYHIASDGSYTKV